MSPRDPAPTRAAIVGAAAALLESGGPEAVTLRSVGTAAGVSRSAAYRHFEDKAELLRALAARTLIELGARIRHPADDSERGGPGEKVGPNPREERGDGDSRNERGDGDSPVNHRSHLYRACAGYLSFALQQPHHYQLIFGDTPIAEPGPELEAAADDAMLALREATERAQADGELGAGPPRELATIIWVLLHGLAQLQITRHLHEPRTIDGDTGLDTLLDLALTSLRPTHKAD